MVIIGASRNGPNPGDGLNGTNLLLKLAHGLSSMFHNKVHEWLPKRTIRLISWGGADVNDMGMVEFLEVSGNVVCHFMFVSSSGQVEFFFMRAFME